MRGPIRPNVLERPNRAKALAELRSREHDGSSLVSSPHSNLIILVIFSYFFGFFEVSRQVLTRMNSDVENVFFTSLDACMTTPNRMMLIIQRMMPLVKNPTIMHEGMTEMPSKSAGRGPTVLPMNLIKSATVWNRFSCQISKGWRVNFPKSQTH